MTYIPYKRVESDLERMQEELTNLYQRRLDGDESEALRRRIACLSISIERKRQGLELWRKNAYESDIRIMI